MKILQLHSPYRIPGGEDTVVANEARLLRSAGHEVWQFFEPNPFAPLRSAGAALASPWNPASAHELAERLQAERPDIAHIHNTWFRLSPSVYRVLKREGIPIVRTLHNYRNFCIQGQTYRDGHACVDCLDGPIPGIRHGCYRGAPMSIVATATQLSHRWSGADDSVVRFITPSAFMRDLVVRGGIPLERTVVKPHFSSDPGERSKPPSESSLVTVLSRLAPGKGVDLLLQAWETLPSGHGMELLIAGSGPLEDQLRAIAPRGVSFGELSRGAVYKRLLDSRALVFPSMLNETFGLATIEAMACGLPVAGFDVAGTSEILGSTSSECLVPPGDIRALGRQLTRLTDDSFVDHHGQANRSRFKDLYDESAQLPQIERIYEDALESI